MIKLLKNRLKRRINKQYVKWWIENKRNPTNEGHHLLSSFVGGKKQNDLLMCNVNIGLHDKLHYHKELVTELETNEMIIESLDSIFDYVEFLQKEVEYLNITFGSTSN